MNKTFTHNLKRAYKRFLKSKWRKSYGDDKYSRARTEWRHLPWYQKLYVIVLVWLHSSIDRC